MTLKISKLPLRESSPPLRLTILSVQRETIISALEHFRWKWATPRAQYRVCREQLRCMGPQLDLTMAVYQILLISAWCSATTIIGIGGLTKYLMRSHKVTRVVAHMRLLPLAILSLKSVNG